MKTYIVCEDAEKDTYVAETWAELWDITGYDGSEASLTCFVVHAQDDDAARLMHPHEGTDVTPNTDVKAALRARFDGLQGPFRRVNPYRYPDDQEPGAASRLPYDHLDGSEGKPSEDYCWFEPEHCGGSDYNGDTVCRSNYRVLLAACEEIDPEGDFFQELYGGYGTYALVLHCERTPNDIVERLAGLCDYPVLDEDDLSELELEDEQKAWEDWAAKDFRKALAEHHGIVDSDGDVDPDLLTNDKDALFTAWHEACQHEGWHCEHDNEGPRFNFDESVLDRADVGALKI